MESLYLFRVRNPGFLTVAPTTVGLLLASASFFSERLPFVVKAVAAALGVATVMVFLWLSSVSVDIASDRLAFYLTRRDPHIQDLLTSASDDLLWEHLTKKHPQFALRTIVEALRRRNNPPPSKGSK